MLLPVTPGRSSPWRTPQSAARRMQNVGRSAGRGTGTSPNMVTPGSGVVEATSPKSVAVRPPAPSTIAPAAPTPAAPVMPTAPVAPAKPSKGSMPPPAAPEKRAPTARVQMTPATAQRRASWNAAALLLLYGVPAVWPRLLDVYYDVLEMVVELGKLPPDADELIDTALVWLRYAVTIVFVLNLAEALMVRAPPPSVEARPTEVGAAFARSVSSGSPLTRPDAPLKRKPSGVPSPVTPASPAPGSPARSPSLRAESPYGRASAASPYALGRGRPSTPSSARVPSGATARRTPSHKDVFAGRSVSRSSPGYTHSPRARTELGTWEGVADLDDAHEVELALQQLR